MKEQIAVLCSAVVLFGAGSALLAADGFFGPSLRFRDEFPK